MSNKLNHSAQNYSDFAAMTTQELKELLRLDSEAPEGQEVDAETILQITEELLKREQANTSEITAQKSWESFQQYYLPELEEGLDGAPEETQPDKPVHILPRRWLAAAAAIALLICIPLSIGALNRNKRQDIIATWKDGSFSFISTGNHATTPEDFNTLPYDSLQDAFIGMGNGANLLPTWIPEGYVLVDIVVEKTPQRQIGTALYAKGNSYLSITVRSYSPSNPTKYEINDQLVELYQSKGTDYYIFYNCDLLTAIWMKDSYECHISGDLSITEIKTMIDSIGEG